jgi:beta-lactamase regulating signal transducer with metallopeptidase domain
MTIGFTRPVVLLPAGWREWDARKVRSVLAHELAHARRGDFAWQLVGELNLCFFWFHPVAWLLQRRLSLAAERACDDSAILAVGDHCAYARHLVDVASALNGRRGRVVAVGIPMAQPCQIRTRVEAILDRDRRRSMRLGRAAAVFVVVLASVVWVSAASVCWERTAAAAQPDSEIACPDEAAASAACPDQ